MTARLRGWLRVIGRGSGSNTLEIDFKNTPRAFMTMTTGSMVMQWTGSFGRHWRDQPLLIEGNRAFDVFTVTRADRHEAHRGDVERISGSRG